MRLVGSLTVAALLPVLYAQDGGAVEGIVVNAVTGVGIGGATVRLTFRQDHYETVTDGAGEFRISGIKPGDYVAIAEKATYSVPPSQAFRRAQVHIGSEKEPVRLRFELLPPATLRGRVFGIDGNPAVRAKVDVGGGQVRTTGDDGSFVFENLPPGSYTLVARPQASASASRVQDGVRTEILPTYFPSVLDLAAAQEIRLQSGADQSGYDIRLQAAPVYRVRGVVLDSSGKPSAKAVVGIVSKAAGGSARGFISVPYGPFGVTDGPLRTHDSLIEPAVTGSDGGFEFPSVPAGDWILRAESDTVYDEARQRDLMLYGGEEIHLGRDDIDDAQIQVLPSFDLSVSFELSDGSPAPENAGFQVAFLPEDAALPDVVSRRAEPNKPPRVENLQPGRYRIQARTLFDTPYYASRIMVGDAEATGQAAELSPASPPVRVILKPAPMLRGVVKEGEGSAVIVWPQSTAPGDFGKAIPCGAGGNFETRGLAPGDYYALAVDRYDPREMTTAAYLRGVISHASSVRLEEGASASLELSLR